MKIVDQIVCGNNTSGNGSAITAKKQTCVLDVYPLDQVVLCVLSAHVSCLSEILKIIF